MLVSSVPLDHIIAGLRFSSSFKYMSGDYRGGGGGGGGGGNGIHTGIHTSVHLPFLLVSLKKM